jgi:DNA-binding GntR family transcriptional regulator
MDLAFDIAGSIEPLAPVPALSQRVHLTLERLIITRQLQPGVRLVEGDLAQMLGVSRGPIREALQRLAQDGFVELRPRQGAFVHVPTMAEIDNFYDVRRVLEGESARLAALRISGDGAQRLRECIRRAEESLANNQDPATTVEDLHKIISSIASNQLLTQFLELLTKRSDWYMAPFEPRRRRKAWNEHAVIVEAIAAGREHDAAAAMIAHIDGAREQYKELRGAIGDKA